MVNAYFHNPVLLSEVVDCISSVDGNFIVDGTLGLGGYSRAILENDSDVKIAAFDLDCENLSIAKKNLAEFVDRVVYYNANFSDMKEILSKDGSLPVNAIVLDLGLASTHVDNAKRGFSFLRDGELDMRFDNKKSLTAKEIVNTYTSEHLEKIFRQYGEEKKARKIAFAIAERRKIKPFEKTVEFADFIDFVSGGRKKRIHSATKVFQALRIEVNDEINSLAKVLEDSVDVLDHNGRIAVVSYHSLEDRLVKNFFRDQSKHYVNLPDSLTTTYLEPKFKLITKKPIVPSSREISQNPRARSAKLRIAQKI